MQVVTHVPATSAQIGGCYLCKCDQRHEPLTNELEPMLDTGIELEITVRPDDLDAIFATATTGNSLIICRSCILEAAALFGALPPEKAEQLAAENEEMAAAYFHQADELEAAQAGNRALAQDLAVFGVRPEPTDPAEPVNA